MGVGFIKRIGTQTEISAAKMAKMANKAIKNVPVFINI